MAETQGTAITQTGERKLVTDFSKGVFGTSDNFTMAFQMSNMLAGSTIVPRDYQNNPSNCMVAIETANRLNASPLMVMQNLYVIQGRPSWASTFLIATINASGKYDFELQFEEKQKNGKPFSCKCWTEKDGRKVEGIVVDMDMAVAEGWTKKTGSKWNTIPQVMLRYRAAAFFSRMNCPEITLGLQTREEMEDIVVKDVTDTYKEMNEQLQEDLKKADAVNFEDVAIEEKNGQVTMDQIVSEQKSKEPVGAKQTKETVNKGTEPVFA